MSAELIQGTDGWYQARLGWATASRVADIMARTKSGWGASRKNYAAQIIAERLTGVKAESYSSVAMDRGNEVEAEARAAYEFERDIDVVECGFIPHPEIDFSGASPDGLVGDDGLFECKCPNTATHIETLTGASIKGVYMKQMQWQLACTGRKWCDFVSYDPRMPVGMQLFIKRIERDDEMIAEFSREIKVFLKEIETKIFDLKALYSD